MARSTVSLDALGEALRRDREQPHPRSGEFASGDAISRVAPGETAAFSTRASARATRDELNLPPWTVGFSPGVATIGVGLATELLMRALAHVADHGGGDVTLWRQGATLDDDRAARGAGLDVDRELLQMRVALPIVDFTAASESADSDDSAGAADRPEDESLDSSGDTVEIRDFREHDAPAVLTVNNAAFRGHVEQGAWTEATFAQRRREPWFDPRWFLVAQQPEAPHEVVGFNWLRRHPPAGRDPEMGEIYVIGVAPQMQGSGLGRRLAVAGLERVVDSGVGVGLLYVAADNAAAIALYRSLGFVATRTDRAYRARVVPE